MYVLQFHFVVHFTIGITKSTQQYDSISAMSVSNTVIRTELDITSSMYHESVVSDCDDQGDDTPYNRKCSSLHLHQQCVAWRHEHSNSDSRV